MLTNLQAAVQRFCEERDWDQFHGAKDVAIGVVTEAAELLDHFRFLDDAQVAALLADVTKREAVEDELADVLFFLLRFAQRFDVGLAAAPRVVRSPSRPPAQLEFSTGVVTSSASRRHART